MIKMIALLLIASAVCHAGWNIIAKGAKDKLTFLWCQIVFAAAVMTVPVLLFCPAPKPEGYIFLAISGIMQAAYYFLLAKTYSIGEISVVYPLTRGSAPVFVCLFSALIGTENITLPVFLSVLMIFAGIYTVNMKKFSAEEFAAPIKTLAKVPQTRLALLNGLIVAAYTLSDSRSVGYCDPLMIYWVIAVIPAVLLAPMIIKRGRLSEEIKCGKFRIAAVSILTFAAYFLVLTAMKHAGASYVSAVREMSVIFVAVYSAAKLKESLPASKIVGSVMIFAGIVLLSYFSEKIS